jgi:hypothetical protein
MSNITVASGETFRLHDQLSPSDTVTIQPGGLLIADRLSFIAPAGDIIVQNASGSEPAGTLEIQHVAPVVRADFSFNHLTLNFADGTSTRLNTLGTSDAGNLHPFQVSGSGAFFLAPSDRSKLPPNAQNNGHSVPTNFIIP